MRSLAVLTVLTVVLAACGTDEAQGPGTTDAPGSTSTTITPTLPGIEQRDLLHAAQEAWNVNRPNSYRFTFQLACECDQGPWTVLVDGETLVSAAREDGEPLGDYLPYESIDAIFAEIRSTLDAGEVPVDVEYDTDFGYPRSYIWNGPELPVDGGFILTVTSFESDPGPGDPELRQELVDAIVRWAEAATTDHDYTFTRGCFCPAEFVGPYQVQVRGGEVTRATLKGTDLLDIDVLEIGRYDEIIKTVPGVFAEIERALLEADRIEVEFHPILGYPTDVFIDWDLSAADEEVSYRIEGFREPLPVLATCSTTGLNVELVDQPGLPDAVAATRGSIFAAAMACDVGALAAISDVGDGVPVETSFGGSGPEYFLENEQRGIPALRTLVEHLNLPYGTFQETGSYAWPSAFVSMRSPYGDGIPPAEYQALLELYTVESLEESFEFFEGYAGYRVVIGFDGEWLFAISGD